MPQSTMSDMNYGITYVVQNVGSGKQWIWQVSTVFIHIKARLIYIQGLKYMLGIEAEWMK